MNRWLRRLAYAVGGLVSLVLVLVAGIYAASEMKLRRTYAIAPEHGVTQQGAATPAAAPSVERGRHLARAINKCVDCHGEQMQGKLFVDAPGLGKIYTPNLTRGRGGIGDSLSDADVERAVRHGVGPSGRGLLIMPATDYNGMSDADLADVTAWLRSLPPVDNATPRSSVQLIGRALLATGKLPMLDAARIDQATPHPASVTPAPTKEYGRYIAAVGGCMGCHGPTLSGGPIPTGPPDWPPAANLTPAGRLATWSEADFVKALRTGVRPDGSTFNPVMPWKLAGEMTDDEMHAVWTYLKSVPGKASGGR